MVDLDPSSFASMEPKQFAQLVKSLSDKELREIFAGPSREAVLDAIFDRFPGMFRPDKAKDADARVNFVVTGGPDEGKDTYSVIVKDGAAEIEKGSDADPTTSLMMGPSEFCKLITGSGNPVMMVMSGKIKARGDLGVAMAFSNWFNIPKA